MIRSVCTRSLAVPVVAVLAVVATCARAADPTPAATASNRTPGMMMAPGVRLIERVWWNQSDLVAALQLKDAQRAQMDKLFVQALEGQRAVQHKQMEQRMAFEQALIKGDWGAARTIAGELREAMAEALAPQTTLKIDVLSLLDENQRQTLASQYLYVLRRPWVVGTSMGGTAVRTPRGAIK